MLFKKKLFKKKQLILKYVYIQNELYTYIKKSLLFNHYNPYMFRLSFTNVSQYQNTNTYFKSKQKLICLHTLGKKIPSKHFLFSRFFLNKQLNSLKISNVYS